MPLADTHLNAYSVFSANCCSSQMSRRLCPKTGAQRHFPRATVGLTRLFQPQRPAEIHAPHDRYSGELFEVQQVAIVRDDEISLSIDSTLQDMVIVRVCRHSVNCCPRRAEGAARHFYNPPHQDVNPLFLPPEVVTEDSCDFPDDHR